MPKDLLVHVDEGPSVAHRLKAACALAEAFEAHLTALAVVLDPYIPDVAGVGVPPEIIEEQRKRADERAQATLDKATETARRHGITLETRKDHCLPGDAADRFARHARHADLVIVGQPDPDHGGNEDLFVETAFLASGRPALVIPYIGARTMPPERVLVAWDGSAQATRAIHDALPFLRRASSVTIIIVDHEGLGDAVGDVPGADIATHLARHGIDVTINSITRGDVRTADAILAEASDGVADLLVMGGYGHARLRELVLGGSTRHVLEQMVLPVMFSH